MAYLKIGDWSLHTNGICGTLRIQEIDELGRIFGKVCDEPIRGWWSKRAHRLTFVRERRRADAADDQGFEGYAWDEPTNAGAVRLYHLAGSFETFGGGGGARDRQTFGWFATYVRAAATSRGELRSERDAGLKVLEQFATHARQRDLMLRSTSARGASRRSR